MKLKILVLIAFACCSITACGRNSQKADAGPREAVPLAVTAAEAVNEKVERRIDITGTLAAWEEATVSIEAEGRLAAVTRDLGDRVRKGDVLARVDPVEYEWRNAQAEAELKAAGADFKRQEELFKKNLSARQQLDDAKRRLDVAGAAADLARKKLLDTSLKAPFDGFVSRRMVNAGEYIRAGTAAFHVVMTTPLKFRGDVPERHVYDVRKGDEVLAYIEARGEEEPLKGRIARVGASVALDTRSFPVEAEVENPAGAIKPGTFARLSILTKTMNDALTIPESAISFFAGNPRVFVIRDGRAQERVIMTGGKVRDRVLVTGGLKAGEKVAASGVELLTEGRAVQVRQ
jgi:membrane fusion protein (multidrug efflux system)